MALQTTTNKIPYPAAVGSTFSFPFRIILASDLNVFTVGSSGIVSPLVLGTGYTLPNVSINNAAGGTITLTTPLTGLVALNIERIEPVTQLTSLANEGAFFPAVVEQALDKLTMIDQQQAEMLSRAVVLPDGYGSTPLPTPVSGSVLGWAGTAWAWLSGASVTLAANLLTAAAGYGTTLVNYLAPYTGAVGRLLVSVLAERVSVFDFMTSAQIADVQAYTYTLDVTTAINNAINAVWGTGKVLRFPPGGYLTTNGITIAAGSTSQGKILYIEGAGCGNPFTLGSADGTILKTTANVSGFQVTSSPAPLDSGTLIIKGFQFWTTSSTNSNPAVYLQTFYGMGEFSHNVIYQAGTGNGLQIDYMTTSEVHNNYISNRDNLATGLGAARVGIGLYLNHQYDSGLQTIRKNTCRGFKLGYQIGSNTGGTGTLYSASLQDCECSYNYNGIWLTNYAKSTMVKNCYLEGGEGGYGVWDQGDGNKVLNCFFFWNYSTHIKSTDFNYGSVYEGNTFFAGNVAGSASQVLVDITSSATHGGPGKTCSNNHFSFGGSGVSPYPANVIGLRVNGTDPRLNLSGNSFYPRGPWLNTGCNKFVGNVGGFVGLGTAFAGDLEIPFLSRGAISLHEGEYSLNYATNGSGTILTIPDGSYFILNDATGINNINQLSAGLSSGMIITFRANTGNKLTFVSGSYMKLAGGASFAGTTSGGFISFLVDNSGGTTTAYEISRSTY